MHPAVWIFLTTIALPVGLVSIALAVLARPWRRAESFPGFGPALAVALGVAGVSAAIAGSLAWWPADATLRLPHAIGLALAGGGIAGLAALASGGRGAAAARVVVFALVGAGSLWFVTAGFTRPAYPAEWTAPGAVLFALAGLGFAGVMAPGAAALASRGPLAPLTLSLIVGGSGPVVALAHSAKLGQTLGGAGVALFTLAVFAWRRPGLTASGAWVSVGVVGAGFLWASAMLYADLPPLAAGILALAPLSLGVSRLPGLRGRAGWLKGAVQLAVAAGFLGGAAWATAASIGAEAPAGSTDEPSPYLDWGPP